MPTTVLEQTDIDEVDVWLFIEGLFAYLNDIRQGSKVVLTYQEEPVAAVVSVEDLRKLTQLERRNSKHEPNLSGV